MTSTSVSQIKRRVAILFVALLCVQVAFTSETESSNSKQAREALELLNSCIGEWSGTGQVRRGSTQGAWRQTGEFIWDFSAEFPAIKYRVKDGKLAEEGILTWNTKDRYRLSLKVSESETRLYTGDWTEGKLLLSTQPNSEGISYRITFTPLNEKRTLVLHEKTSSVGTTYFRVAEVGYTRAGTRLALPGGGQRECVVTGGTAQTAVTYQGETYYVCCSGCKQAFDDDPAGIIADFKARLQARLNSVKK